MSLRRGQVGPGQLLKAMEAMTDKPLTLELSPAPLPKSEADADAELDAKLHPWAPDHPAPLPKSEGAAQAWFETADKLAAQNAALSAAHAKLEKECASLRRLRELDAEEYGQDRAEIAKLVEEVERLEKTNLAQSLQVVEKLGEFEALRAENERLRKAVEQNYSIKNLEIKRLREALEKIAEGSWNKGD
jgi:chromosome segregation ATPase